MDHGERDRIGPVVHLPIQNVLVVDDDGEAEEDPYGHIGVGEDDFLDNAIGDRHCFWWLKLRTPTLTLTLTVVCCDLFCFLREQKREIWLKFR